MSCAQLKVLEEAIMRKLSKTIPKEFISFYYNHRDPYKWTDDEIKMCKDLLSECDQNAHTRNSAKDSILHFHLPFEVIKWCIERGADVNDKNTYGTPLFKHAYDKTYETCKLLIEHGADVNIEDYEGNTALFNAADNGAVNVVKLLIEHGADSGHHSNHNGYNRTPLLYILSRGNWSCGDIAEILVHDQKKNGGIPDEEWITAQKYVLEMGYEYELQKSDKSKYEDDEKYKDDPELYKWLINSRTEMELEYKDSFKKLYSLFEVEPVKSILKHDGKSPIIIDKLLTFEKKFSTLWDFLVPVNGKCYTVQGEVIRICGRVDNEVNGNGGANWDVQYRKMLKTMPIYLNMGNSLVKEDLSSVQSICEAIIESGGYNCGDEINQLKAVSLKWIESNHEPIILEKVSYKR